jgi:hypothetical protein
MLGAKYFLVKNFVNDTSFFDWDKTTYNSCFHRIPDATELSIPKLNAMAFEQAEIASASFLKFIANKGLHDEATGLFIYAARLCPPLVDERLEGVRPH